MLSATSTRFCASTATRSVMVYSVSRSWVIRIRAAPVSFCAARIAPRTVACPVTSSAFSGSSATMTSGLFAIAMALPPRLPMPPLPSLGNVSIRFSPVGTRAILTRSCARFPPAPITH